MKEINRKLRTIVASKCLGFGMLSTDFGKEETFITDATSKHIFFYFRPQGQNSVQSKFRKYEKFDNAMTLPQDN